MCLAVPVQILELPTDDKPGKVLMSGAACEVSFALLEDVRVGDYVLVHAGMAIQRVSPEEAEESLRVLAEFMETIERQDAEAPSHEHKR